MPEATKEFIVEILQDIQADVLELKDDIRDVNTRLGSLEVRMAQIKTQLDGLLAHVIESCVRWERQDDMIELAMRRLETTRYLH